MCLALGSHCCLASGLMLIELSQFNLTLRVEGGVNPMQTTGLEYEDRIEFKGKLGYCCKESRGNICRPPG